MSGAQGIGERAFKPLADFDRHLALGGGYDQQYTVGKLQEINERGVTIIGAKTSEGEYLVNPPADYQLMPNSKIFILGSTDQIASFKS